MGGDQLVAKILAVAGYCIVIAISGVARADERWNLGFGMGDEYGGIGANVEVSAGGYGGITAGLGMSFAIGIGEDTDTTAGWNVGGSFYFRSRDERWRPRASARFGNQYFTYVDAVVPECFAYPCPAKQESKWHNALAVGLGSRWMFGSKKKHGFDLDLSYLASPSRSKVEDDATEDLRARGYDIRDVQSTMPVRLSFGYRVRF